MDKETLSNYGWIVICVLVLAVMLALATPFGTFVADAVKSTTQGLFDVNQSALNSTGLINVPDQEFTDTNSGSNGGEYVSAFPLAWNSLDVVGNPTIMYDGVAIVKISNLVPSKTEFRNSTCTFSEGAEPTTLECTIREMRGDMLYVSYQDYVMTCFVVPEAGEYEAGDSGTAYFPEAGIYVPDYGSEDLDIDFVIDSPYVPSVDNGIDLTDVDPVLANNDWETIQKVVQANKVEEAGWNVGDISPEFTYNGQTFTARIIGIEQDGANTVTFMLTQSVGNYNMNKTDENGTAWNIGGFAASELNAWLNGDVFNGLSDNVKSVIKPVTKKSSMEDTNPNLTTSATYNLFLLSVKEAGLADEVLSKMSWYTRMDTIEAESDFVYEFFKTNDTARRQQISNSGLYQTWWLRTAYSMSSYSFFKCGPNGEVDYYGAYVDYNIMPAFVVG